MFGIGSTELIVFGVLALIVFARRVAPLVRAYRSVRGPTFGRPQFAVKDLLVSTALIAVGLAWIVIALPLLRDALDYLEFPVWMFVIGGTFVGAGALRPLKITTAGALVGAIVQLLIVWSARSVGWPHF
jgi:hypothetical protein